ncbi:MAG: hypothetical protein HXX20_09510, partial [Chloroflexi bacterium]|nr:hypothetical protein [Chloroflexota bacterium]
MKLKSIPQPQGSGKAKDKGKNKEAVVLPTTDTALPINGVERGIVSLKGGGATLLLEVAAIAFETVSEEQLDRFQRTLSDAFRAVSKTGAGAGDDIVPGLTITMTMLQRKLEMSSLIASYRKASGRVDLLGLATFSLNELDYMKDQVSTDPFVYRRYFIGLTLDKTTLEQEIEGITDDSVTLANLQMEEVWRDALDLSAKAGERSAETITSSRNVLKPVTVGGKKWYDQVLTNIKEGLGEIAGSSGMMGGSSSFKPSSSSIASNPISVALASNLCHKADILMSSLRSLGIASEQLNSKQTAEVISQLLNMPSVSPDYLVGVLDEEIGRLNAISEGREPISTVGSDSSLKDYSLFTPLGGNLQGQIDSNLFALAPLEVTPHWLRVGIYPGIASKLDGYFQASMKVFKAIKRKSPAQAQILANAAGGSGSAVGTVSSSKSLNDDEDQIVARKILEDLKNGFTTQDGDYYDLPRASYVTSLYAADWPRGLTMGFLNPLVSRRDLEMVVTIHLKPIPKKKAQRKLDTLGFQMGLVGGMDQTSRGSYERGYKAQAISDLQSHLASETGALGMVGLRVAIRADSPDLLDSQVRSVQSSMSSLGLTLNRANHNQAMAWYSALPFRDYLSQSFMVGKKTQRNMPFDTAVCLWPGLIVDQTGNPKDEDIYIGQGPHGGIYRLKQSLIGEKHIFIAGQTGAGKSFTFVLLFCGRWLLLNPNGNVFFIDPQGLWVKAVQEFGGTVYDMSNAGGTRLNFLDRFVLFGKPQPFGDMVDTFNSFLSLMQRQELSAGERTSVTNALLKVIRHFESGESITRDIVEGLKLRFFDALGFANVGRAELMIGDLDRVYSFLNAKYSIPDIGYMVKVALVECRCSQRKSLHNSLR